MKIDMHIHTTASDGTWTPDQLIAEIVKNDIDIFAVTDHDTLENIRSVQALAQITGKKLIPGLEVSSTLEGNLFHILGYGIDPDNTVLQELVAQNMELMRQKDNESIRTMIDNGYKINFEDFLAYEDHPGKGGWKALNFLIETGVCRDAADFFNNVFTEFNRLTFPKFASPEQVINAIAQAGGIPILAHPGLSIHEKGKLEEVLEKFYQQGIQGVETFHPQHNDEKARICYDWATEKKLQITGGSDCHGSFIDYRRLGHPDVRLEHLKIDKILKNI